MTTNPEAAAAAPKDEPEQKMHSMKPGDYIVHVHVQSAKNLQMPGEDTCDPYIEVKCAGADQSTDCKKKITMDSKIVFDTHMFLELKDKTKEQLDEAQIEVFAHHKGFFKGDLIGKIDVTLSKIYNMKGHVMKHQKMGLCNPKAKDFEKLTGLVVVSINVQGPGDEATELLMGGEKELAKIPIMMPSSAKRTYKQIYFRIYQGLDLPMVDSNMFKRDGIDAYMKVKYRSHKGKTEVKTTYSSKKKGNIVKWNTEFMVPVSLPINNNKFELELWDYDTIGDDQVSSIDLSIKDILKYEKKYEMVEEVFQEGKIYENPKPYVRDEQKYIKQKTLMSDNSKWQWVHLYGSPPKKDNDYAEKMNTNPELASHWAGMILVQYWCEEQKFPEFKTKILSKEEMTLVKEPIAKMHVQHNYAFIYEFGQGLCLPDNEEYRCEIGIANQSWKCDKPKECKVNREKTDWCRWDHRKQIEFTSVLTMDQMPTFFIYLIDSDGARVCYYRDSFWGKETAQNHNHADEEEYIAAKIKAQKGGQMVRRYNDPDWTMQWTCFEPDRAIDIVSQDHKAGYFSYRLYLEQFKDKKEAEGSWADKIKQWKKKIPKRLNPFQCRIGIYQCERLPPADSNGTSDPYVEVYVPGNIDEKMLKTDHCNDTNNPIYYQVKDFAYECDVETKKGKQVINYGSAPPIILNLWDYDDGLLEGADDFIGRCVIHLSEHAVENQYMQKPGFPTEAISYDPKVMHTPHWCEVKKIYDDKFSDDVGARILISLQFIGDDEQFLHKSEDLWLNKNVTLKHENKNSYAFKMPDLDIRPYHTEISMLGLRDLVSTGLLPVNKAYTVFSLKSLLPSSQAKAVDNIKTEPSDKGSNPVTRGTLGFEVELPSEKTYIPKMTCTVFDQLFFSMLPQPMIGVFTLPLGEYQEDYRMQLAQYLKELKEFSRKIKKILDYKKQAEQSGTEPKSARDLLMEHALQDYGEDNVLTEVELQKYPEDKRTKIKKGMDVLNLLEKISMPIPARMALMAKSVKNKKPEATEDGDTSKADSVINLTFDEQQEKMKTVLKSNIRNKVQWAFMASEALRRMREDHQREADQAKISGTKTGFQTIILPEYEKDERLSTSMKVIYREINIPPKNLFMPIGYNKKKPENKEEEIKHYRRYYNDELEFIEDKPGEFIVNTPFVKREIYRAKPVKSGGLIGGLFGGDDVEEEFSRVYTGYFKGMVRCYNKEEYDASKNEINNAFKELIDMITQLYKKESGGGAKIVLNQVEKIDMVKIDQMKKDDKQEVVDAIHTVCKEGGLEKLNINRLMNSLIFQEGLIRHLNEVQTTKVYLYVLEGFNFAERDLFSPSDPYVVVQCGKKFKVDNRENYILNDSSPKIYESFMMQVEFPGAPRLKIEAMDYDDFFGDDLIGRTYIDLDDRFYSQNWGALKDKPIEYRDLADSTSTVSQGVLKCWVDIYDINSPQANMPPVQVTPAPMIKFEVRVVIWKTKDIEMKDVEGTSDAYVTCFFDPNKEKTTDTHWRCQNGKASFNWRMKFPYLVDPNNDTDNILTLQCYDRDILSSNDLIGQCQVPLDCMIDDALMTHAPRYLNHNFYTTYWKEQLEKSSDNATLLDGIDFEKEDGLKKEQSDKMWIPLTRVKDEDELKEGESRLGSSVNSGYLLISVQICPEDWVEKNPQGNARDEPNNDPHCPPPEGRLKLSLNPFDMWRQMIGPAMRRKICFYFLWFACCALCIMCAPMIFSNLVTRMIV